MCQLNCGPRVPARASRRGMSIATTEMTATMRANIGQRGREANLQIEAAAMNPASASAELSGHEVFSAERA